MDPSNQTSDIRSFVHLSISQSNLRYKMCSKNENEILRANHCEWCTKSLKEYFCTVELFLEHEEKMSETDCVYKINDRVDEYIKR